MIELAYTSTTPWLYSTEELRDILSKSRTNNAKTGITGILLYRARTVLQLLEGEAEAVHALYAKLLLDPRHHSLTLLYDRPLAERNFGQWSMAFEHLAESESFGDGVHRMTRHGLIPDLDLQRGLRARRLLDTFVQHVH